nr:hypothetical protein [Tanacetum cinerariifolium]
FDQTQPPQFPVIHPPLKEISIEILHDQENAINSVQTFLRKFNRYSFFETPKVLLLAWDRVFEIKDAFGNKQYKPEDIQELFRKLFNDVQNIHEELAEYINTPGWNHPVFYNNGDDDDVDYTIAITPVLSTKEPDNSLKISSGSTTTHSDTSLSSLSEYDSFIFDLSNDQFPPTDRSDFTHEEFADELAHIISPPKYDCFYFRNLPDPGEWISILNSGIRENLSSTTRVNLPVEDDHSPLLAYVVWILFAYLTYPVIPPYLHSFENEDTIFDPSITINRFYSWSSRACDSVNKNKALRGRYLMLILVQYFRKREDSCQRILSSKSSFPQLQLGIKYPNVID